MLLILNLQKGCLTEVWAETQAVNNSSSGVQEVIQFNTTYWGNDHFMKMQLMAIYRERAFYKLRDNRDQFRIIQ